jgi:leucyl aminopeptidase (aminopeptidase T)
MLENMGYTEGIRVALETCLGVKKGEEVLIVGDTDNLEIAVSFAEVTASLGVEVSLIIMKPREMHGIEPSKSVAAAMLGADVILMPTSKSLTHTDAREAANKRGARIASMPAITREILRGPMKADYQRIREISERLADILTKASKASLTTDLGTNIELEITGRKAIADTGILIQPGAIGNLPAGEVFCAPLEDKGDGVLVFNVSMGGVGRLHEQIQVEVREGKVISIKGGSEAKDFESILEQGDANAFNIAELGIGTNPEAIKPIGNLLVDEKLMGTVHIAFGDNSHFGGLQKSNIHIDGVISKPTLKLDGEVIIDAGKVKWGSEFL